MAAAPALRRAPSPWRLRVGGWGDRFGERVGSVHPAAWLTVLAVIAFGVVFSRLAAMNQRNFGTWAYDMGIYDQAFWLVSRGGHTFMSVRGMDVWGHHVNLIAFAFAPLYWLGGGATLLYVVQAWWLAAGGIPTYLIARDRLGSPWWGLLLAVVYLMYAPVQWISWAMFHPEALIITPFLFAWWFATCSTWPRRWVWYWAMVLLVLSMREDVALALIVLGVVLAVRLRHDLRRVRRHAAATVVVGAVWYLVATRVVLPHFNDGKEPFYITYFYGEYGSSIPEIVGTMVRRPGMVLDDATRPDRLAFYRHLLHPLGWMPLVNPLALLMAVPQMVASVIGLSPYARMIRYQYTSVMIAPLVIATVDGVRALVRAREGWLAPVGRAARVVLPFWLVIASVSTNMDLSPSPLGREENHGVWSRPHPRHESLREALTYVPDDAAVSASFQLVPHLSHRRHVYDWPNPFVPAVWGNDDCDRLPDPRIITHVILDKLHIGENNEYLFEEMFAPPRPRLGDAGDPPFEVLYEDDAVIVGRRVGSTPELDERPQRDSCRMLAARRGVAGSG